MNQFRLNNFKKKVRGGVCFPSNFQQATSICSLLTKKSYNDCDCYQNNLKGENMENSYI